MRWPQLSIANPGDSKRSYQQLPRHRLGLTRVLGVKHQLRTARNLVVYSSEYFSGADVHSEALVGGLLSPFF